MACSSCGKPRVQMSNSQSRSAPRASSLGTNVRTVDSQTLGKKVQSAVASNPNSPKRTKV